eukprot:CAMPEP_0205820552 /NCGR_PEP_ID=MMETSP0206-20130828/3207_1 /ASSEMBLY_ACC=CAM_ASM_000279 /TAXON_ID=36767 /ORGANISM="Euplotes focardii, Strain TN1" /LENGTH=261 /DNA_ID=CAMNT_0053115383 /DNA_START=23 /DNA_END=810 /DNA_ORIENTATION=-
MSRRGGGDAGTRVYVGNLDKYTDKKDIEDAFYKFGRINNIWVAHNPPGFAFVDMEDARDAEDAVHDLNGRKIAGCTARVEISREGDRSGRGGGGGGEDVKCFNCNGYGHFARDCPQGRNRGECYNCGEMGHQVAIAISVPAALGVAAEAEAGAAAGAGVGAAAAGAEVALAHAAAAASAAALEVALAREAAAVPRGKGGEAEAARPRKRAVAVLAQLSRRAGAARGEEEEPLKEQEEEQEPLEEQEEEQEPLEEQEPQPIP